MGHLLYTNISYYGITIWVYFMGPCGLRLVFIYRHLPFLDWNLAAINIDGSHAIILICYIL